MTKDLKNTLTNILGIVLVVLGAGNAYLQSIEGDVDLMQLGIAIVAAVIAYVTGKDKNVKAKIQP